MFSTSSFAVPFRATTLVGAFLLALAFILQPLGVSAHDHRDVGDYTITVGFITEPAVQGDTNGIWVEFMKGEAPVTGLADTVKAEVIFGDQTREFELVPAWGEDGVYQAVFIPTEPGDYTFRFFGQIEGVDIDESFTSSPEGFDSVSARADLEFPTQDEGENSGNAVTVAMPIAAGAVLLGAVAWGLRRRQA